MFIRTEEDFIIIIKQCINYDIKLINAGNLNRFLNVGAADNSLVHFISICNDSKFF